MSGREYTSKGFVCALVLVTGLIALPAMADVGEPIGAGPGNTFGIKITQGATVLLDKNDVVMPSDIKINDGDPEGYVVLDTWDAGLPSETDIILKVVSMGGARENMRTISFYVDAVDPINIYQSGLLSLFDPTNADPISVEISNISFVSTLTADPFLIDQDQYYVSFMRDQFGNFYEFADAHAYNAYGNGLWDVEVPGSTYLDGNASEYSFSATSGAVTSWTWSNLINPGPLGTTTADMNGNTGLPATGFVHELGMAVSFTGIPEPATLSMLMLAPLVMRHRRRR